MQTQHVNMAQAQVMEAQFAAARNGVGAVGSNLTDAQKAAAREAAEQFEAVFISQMLNPMFEAIPTDGLMGGGPAEGVYRSMMVDEASKSIARNGGVGIADNVYRELLKMQEV
ncbi:rod-binding protein [Kordiimonas sp.]|uniref:rod-binding protein n=1 Tax=Kordiimonas sp. TaxID=1970157 RepID=UPI003A8CC000